MYNGSERKTLRHTLKSRAVTFFLVVIVIYSHRRNVCIFQGRVGQGSIMNNQSKRREDDMGSEEKMGQHVRIKASYRSREVRPPPTGGTR